MTTIEDVLTYIDGSKANGRLVVAWKPFTIEGANAAGGELEWFIVDGVVSIELYSNITALPTGSYYTAKYELENGAVYTEQWVVPNLPIVNLGQVRVAFPPSPSVMISPLQLTSLNAQPGMFLQWNGQRWVPGYPSSFNLTPNWIGIVPGVVGNDVNVQGSPVSLGSTLTFNIPDASLTARGVVNLVAQSFRGAKTFEDLAATGNLQVVGTAAIAGLVGIGTAPGVYPLSVAGDVNLIGGSYRINGVPLITNAVPPSRVLTAGVGLAGGGDLSADRAFSVVDDTSIQKHRFSRSGTFVAARRELNVIQGANVSLTMVDDAGNNRVDLTVASTGGGSGSQTPWVSDIDGDGHNLGDVGRLAIGGSVLTGTNVSPFQVLLGFLAEPVGSILRGATIMGFGRNVDRFLIDFERTSIPTDSEDVDWTSASWRIIRRVGGDFGSDLEEWIAFGEHRIEMFFGQGAAPSLTIKRNFIGVEQPVPNFALDVTGDVNVTGVYRVNGVPISTSGGVPLTRQVIAGAGMSGGGALSADVTLNALVTSVFGRTGAVVLTSADITAAGGVPSTRTLTAGAGLTGGGDLSANRSFAVVDDTSIQKNRYSKDNALVAARRELNVITGANVTLTMADDAANNRVNLTIAAAAGGSSGMTDPTTTLGDLIVRGSAAPLRLGVGANNQVLTADSAQALGVKWATPSTGSPQTPWVSDIAAAGFKLNNTGGIGIGGVASSSKLGITAGALGGTAGDAIIMQSAAAPTSNFDELSTILSRATTGTDWTTALWRIGRKVDSSDVAGVEFGAFLVALRTQGINRLLVNAVGNIGIGTASPASRLHVGGPQNASGGISIATDANDATLYGYQIYRGTSGELNLIGNQGGAAAFVFGNPTERMRIAASGNVGVGTASPAGTLEVQRSQTDSGAILRLAVGPTNGFTFSRTEANGTLNLQGNQIGFNNIALCPTSGNVGVGTASPAAQFSLGLLAPNPASPISYPNADQANFNFYAAVDQTYQRFLDINVSGANAGAHIRFLTQQPSSASVERMRITASGNVGIGTASPQGILHVDAFQKWSIFGSNLGGVLPPNISGVFAGWNYSNGVGEAVLAFNGVGLAIGDTTGNTWKERVKIATGGNVGIGTTGPLTPLHVAADVTRQLTLSGTASPTTSHLKVGYDVSNNTGVIDAVNGGAGTFLLLNPTGGTYGNVGIGTTNPATRLHVSGPSGAPSAASDTGVALFQTDALTQLAIGGINGGNYGIWLQTKYVSNNGSTWPLLVNPMGGSVIFGANMTPARPFHVHPGGGLNFCIAAGPTVANSVGIEAINDAATVNIPLEIRSSATYFASGAVRIGSSTAPGYALDVTGDVNVSGAFRVNGTPIATGGSGAITTQSVVTVSRVLGTTYPNATGKPMFVSVHCNVIVGQSVSLYADGGSPPTQRISSSSNSGSVPFNFSVCGWVLPGHNYRVVSTSGSITDWVEWT